MTTSQVRTPAPVVRPCDLCGQLRVVEPPTEKHREAHVKRTIAFVCEECAARVRMEVEAAAGLRGTPPEATA